MMPFVTLALIATFLPMAALGASPAVAVDFRGLPLGATEAEFKRANPGFDCSSTGERFATLGDRMCSARREDDPLGNIATFGGQPAIYITAHFVHDRFFMLAANFNSDSFDNVTAALQEKYGPATSKEAPMITIRAGLRASNTQLFWHLGRDTIVAQRYAGTIAEGTVTYRDSSVEGEMRARSREQVKAGAKSL